MKIRNKKTGEIVDASPIYHCGEEGEMAWKIGDCIIAPPELFDYEDISERKDAQISTGS